MTNDKLQLLAAPETCTVKNLYHYSYLLLLLEVIMKFPGRCLSLAESFLAARAVHVTYIAYPDTSLKGLTCLSNYKVLPCKEKLRALLD